MTSESKVQFDLLGNAVDSIDRAMELLAYSEESSLARRLKQSVLSVAHGVELLIKERLRRVHPVLIWENVDKFPSLSARTVTVDTAVNRLTKIGGLKFSEADVQLIESLRDTRNAIEHYAWSTSEREARTIVGQALGFAVHFARVELGINFFDYSDRKDGTFQDLLAGSAEFASAFRERHEQRATREGRFNMLCDYCHALAANPLTGVCAMCGHWNRADNSDDIPF